MCDNFYKLRITMADTDEEHPRDLSNVIHHINRFIHKYKINTCTLGVENMNSRGQACALHIHFHFEYENPDGFVNPHRNLKRYFTSLNIGLKGCSVWSFPAPSLCDDPIRLLRYPLKQKGIKSFFRNNDTSPLDFNYDEQEALAKAEYKDIVKRNMEHDRKSRTTSFYDKLEEHLNDPSMNFREISIATNFQDIVFESITDYYREMKKPINPETINGYTILYLMNQNYISSKQYCAFARKKNNLIINHNAKLPEEKNQQEEKESNP